MMLRLAPAVSPNKVVVLPPSSTRIPTLAAPLHQLVTRKAPSFISLCCSNVDTNYSILAEPLKSISGTVELPETPDDFPFECIEGNVMIKELNREEIHVTITMPEITEEVLSESESNGGGVFPPEGMVLFVKISKGNGISVTFGVTLWPHRMEVYFFRVKSLGLRELEIEMKEKEPGKLERAIQEYLKVRGIKSSYAEFLYRYMVNRHMKLKSTGLWTRSQI